MFKTLDQLITAYDRGVCTRRQLLSALAALGLGSTSVSAEQHPRPGSSIARINHINLRVSNVERSVEFYERLFGPGFRQLPTSLPYDLGGGSMVPYMSVQTCSAPGFLDSGLTVFASTLPRPARRGHVAPERDFDSGISPASTARCTFA